MSTTRAALTLMLFFMLGAAAGYWLDRSIREFSIFVDCSSGDVSAAPRSTI